MNPGSGGGARTHNILIMELDIRLELISFSTLNRQFYLFQIFLKVNSLLYTILK